MKMINKHKGFTIVELMIATTVFSVILLLSLTGFLQIGQQFYKGVNMTRTDDVAKQIISGIKNDIAFDSTSLAITPIQSQTFTVNGRSYTRYWFCAGSNRYTFIKGYMVDTQAGLAERQSQPATPNSWYKYGLLKDRVDVSGGCPSPISSTLGLTANSVTELIGDKMRLSELQISHLPSPNDKLYTINIRIVYGEDSVLQNPNQPNASCISGKNTSSYCFATDLRTAVRRGVLP
jgi:prepilin-type N-terminal cleavage/methylation domain-containing protein